MVAAVALMACNSNSVDPGTSSSVSQLTANVASAFGKSAAEVKTDFEKAGFVKVMNTTGSLTKPAFKKFQPAINKPFAEKNLDVYVLNAPKNFDQLIQMEGEEAYVQLLNSVLDNGKPFVMVGVQYNEKDQFVYAQLNLVAGTDMNAGTLFINTSKDFFKALAGDKTWNAGIYVYPTDMDEKNPPKEEDYYFSYELEERSAYETKLTSVVNKPGHVEDFGYSEGNESTKGIEYNISYSYVSEDPYMSEIGVKAHVTAGGTIAWRQEY